MRRAFANIFAGAGIGMTVVAAWLIHPAFGLALGGAWVAMVGVLIYRSEER